MDIELTGEKKKMWYSGKDFSVSRITIIFTIIINNLSITDSQLQPEEHIRNSSLLLSKEECWKLYPFTYSKCLKLCSPHVDATCLDDQLCYCDNLSFSNSDLVENVKSEMDVDDHFTNDQQNMEHDLRTLPNLNIKFGTNSLATCHFSDFCEELCRNDEKLITTFPAKRSLGALCKIPDFAEENDVRQEIESCVCSISAK